MLRVLVALLFFGLSLGSQANSQQTPPASSDTSVYKVGNGVSPPRALSTTDPSYDEKARQNHIEGVVVLWLIVDENGMPADVKVAKALGFGLDEEAVKAVKQWRFSPAVKDGKPVKVQINVEVHFRLTADHPKTGKVIFSDDSTVVSKPTADDAAGTQTSVVPIKTVRPEYPEAAARDQRQGKVVVKVTIDEGGKVIDAQLVSGDPVFADSALGAAKKWTFQPYVKDGIARKVAVQIPFNFAFSDNVKDVKHSPAETARTDLPPGVSAGMLTHKVTPVYPMSAKLNRIQGSVILAVTISKDGNVKEIQLRSGPPELVQAASDAVQQWRYRPYLLDGKPTEVSTTVQVNFSLR